MVKILREFYNKVPQRWLKGGSKVAQIPSFEEGN
jgi:hypothetical protein